VEIVDIWRHLTSSACQDIAWVAMVGKLTVAVSTTTSKKNMSQRRANDQPNQMTTVLASAKTVKVTITRLSSQS